MNNIEYKEIHLLDNAKYQITGVLKEIDNAKAGGYFSPDYVYEKLSSCLFSINLFLNANERSASVLKVIKQ